MSDQFAARTEILEAVRAYWEQYGHSETNGCPVSGRVLDAKDICAIVDASLDGWLTSGRFAAEFEERFARAVEQRYALAVNSGSSANLLAISALTSPQLGEKALQKGDEVITVGAGFPTTVAPILQNGLIPVFVDIELDTYNIDLSQLELALSSKTRAIILAHTLGNPFDARAVARFAKKHNLWLIEDCCDALGSTLDGCHVGTFGDLATYSFYPAHHITMGEGGAVVMQTGKLKRIVESFRDWGRDCWCAPGCDNTCGCRFQWQKGTLPFGYDHKYIYSHIGYNLKITDMQAAIGCTQLDKLEIFVERRRQNFATLYNGLRGIEELTLPTHLERAKPSWFGFPVRVNGNRRAWLEHLNREGIATRLLFGGNLCRQPAFEGSPKRIIGDLACTDRVMHEVFWVGVYPGLTEEAMSCMIDSFKRGALQCV